MAKTQEVTQTTPQETVQEMTQQTTQQTPQTATQPTTQQAPQQQPYFRHKITGLVFMPHDNVSLDTYEKSPSWDKVSEKDYKNAVNYKYEVPSSGGTGSSLDGL